MKNFETLSREETRKSVEPVFSSSASETTQTVQQSEPNSQYGFADSFVIRDAYRLSPLSEW
jgi:hypothetical protein